jgi:hypothetical protein
VSPGMTSTKEMSGTRSSRQIFELATPEPEVQPTLNSFPSHNVELQVATTRRHRRGRRAIDCQDSTD